MKKIITIFLILYFLFIFSVYLIIKTENIKFNYNYLDYKSSINNTYDNLYNELKNNAYFKKDEIKNYFEFIKKHKTSINNTIIIVNKKLNNLDFYDDDIINFLIQEYYINDNLSRYLNYDKKNNFEKKEIIKRVNSNIDYPFYTNTNKSDLNKNYQILVNKYHYLEKNYIPNNLVKIESTYGISGYLENDTYNAFKKMHDDALKEDIFLFAASPYRSYEVQYNLYNRYASKDGITLADTYSARAGFSEHQTGLAVDISKKGGNITGFEYTNEFKWLEKNCYKYGFILRYTRGNEYITGYQYEPWHYRYVGTDVAEKIYKLNITFEEYYAYFIK